MPSLPRRPLLLALALAAMAATLSACGGEDAELLPGETAREITANLDSVQQLAAEGDCAGAEGAAQQVGEQIEALRDVDPKLKQALERGAIRLEEVIAECEEPSEEAVAPATTPTEPAEEEESEPREKEKKKEKPDKEEEPQEEDEADTPEGSSELPPQANGEGKGLEEGGGPPPSEDEGGEEPSGGVSPGAAVGEAE